MTSNARHKKHANLPKPSIGQFGRLEVAILGAPCSLINKLVGHIINELGSEYKVAYVDADHNIESEGQDTGIVRYTDKITHDRVDFDGPRNQYERKAVLSLCDLVLVNGNHFKADQQIVILNSKKKDSLKRKLDRCTNVLAVLKDDVDDAFDFLAPVLTNDVLNHLDVNDIEPVANLLSELLQQNTPSVKGLILAGGESRRMGMDKTQIAYHGNRGQSQHMYSELSALVDEVFISCQDGQQGKFGFTQNFVLDTLTGLGPFGAICSAFRTNPDAAWLSVASDQPLLSKSHIQKLLDSRDPSKTATCFYNPETDFPEPLITIWEPKSYPVLLHFLSLGFSCPRKVLINSDVKVIKTQDVDFMKNANTPEESKSLLQACQEL